MSGGTLFFLIAALLATVAVLSFCYGFRVGLRAERSNWDLRYMVRSDKTLVSDKSISELEVAINEQLGFWIGETNDVDTEFCEKFMATISHLRPHIEDLARKSSPGWEAVKPVWQKLDFKKVTMATCLEYDLARPKVVATLKDLLTAVGRKPSRKLATMTGA